MNLSDIENNRRNTRKEKKRRNKKYPYKKGGKLRTTRDSFIAQMD